MTTDFPWLDKAVISRYVRTYGTSSYDILKGRSSMADLGVLFAGTLYQAEVEYLMAEEWAHTSEDILWWRTKQGLYANEENVRALDQFLMAHATGDNGSSPLHQHA